MKRTVLILVSADPRTSGRTAEAVRVAAGLSVHERLSVTLCLRGEAAQILGGDGDGLVDGDGVAELLAVLTGAGGRVLVMTRSQTSVSGVLPSAQTISGVELDNLIASTGRVLRF